MSHMHKQSGATLIVSLLMLVILTLLAMSAIRSTTVNMRIAGNMQAQTEMAAVAQQATEQVLSANFTTNPVAQTIQIDVTGSGASSSIYTATVPAPTCTASLAITNADLNPQNAEDVPCISSGTAQNTGLIVAGAAGGSNAQSWCYLQQWEVQAQVTDNRSGATATSVQGVSMRVPVGISCP